MAILLVVVHPFGNYRVGDLVFEDAAIAGVTRGEHGNRTVRVLVPFTINDQSEDI